MLSVHPCPSLAWILGAPSPLRPKSLAVPICSYPQTTSIQPPSLPLQQFNDKSSTRFAPLLNGCWTLAGGHGRIEPNYIMDVMALYARSGLTTFDTADIYGPSEPILGSFRQRWEAQKMKDNLPDIQIFTKFVPNIFRLKLTPATVEEGIRRSMDALKVAKLDLVQLHWWDYSIPGMVDTAKILTDLREEGMISSIGTTNMNTETLDKIVDAGVPVVCNQVQFSLLDRRPLKYMVDYCKERDIKLLTYGSVCGGLLSDKYIGEGKKGMFGLSSSPAPDLNTSSLKMYWGILKAGGGENFWRKLLSVVSGIAARHSVSISVIALAWVMQQGPVHPIVGLRNSAHLDDNLKVLSFSLSKQDMDEIEEVLSDSKGLPGDCYDMERGR